MWCFLLFHPLSIISAFVIKYNVFHRGIRWVENLFISLPVFLESSKTLNSFVLLLTMAFRQVCLPQTKSSFPLRLSESQEKFNSGQVCQPNCEAKNSN